MTALGAVRCVWLRYFDVYRKRWKFALVTTFVEPLLYLFAFGFGLDSMIGTVQVAGIELTYRQFIFAGIAAQTLLFQAFFEAAYGAFIRMYYQRIFQAIATTPITLSEVLWAEIFWDATKATFAASAVLMIGVAMGDFRPSGRSARAAVLLSGSLALRGAWPVGRGEIQDDRGNLLPAVFARLSDVSLLRGILPAHQSARVSASDRVDTAPDLRRFSPADIDPGNTARSAGSRDHPPLARNPDTLVSKGNEPQAHQVILPQAHQITRRRLIK